VPSGSVDDRRTLTALGLRQDWALDVTPRALLKWGVDVRRESAGYDYARWLLRESVARPGEVAARADSAAATRSLAGTRLGLYVAQRLRPVDAVTVEVGLRHDRASAAGDAVTSPRLNVSWQPRAGTTLRAAWGRYSQSQSLASIQVQDGVTALAAAERSEQRVLGVEQALPWGLTARVEAYDQRVSPRRPRWVNAGGELDLIPELTWDRVLVAAERGRSRGVELLLAGDRRGRVDWTASYALASTTDRVAGRDVPRVSDQRHTLHYDWSFHPTSNRWRLTVATLWRTGRPFAPQQVRVDTVVSTAQQLWILPTWYAGELGSERFPSYHRVDARWTRYFDTRRGRLSVFAEVFNLLNTKNVGTYHANVSVRPGRVAVTRSSDTMLSRLPTAGVSWEF
jgi:outer membrane receptor protein involved in Fe transport